LGDDEKEERKPTKKETKQVRRQKAKKAVVVLMNDIVFRNNAEDNSDNASALTWKKTGKETDEFIPSYIDSYKPLIHQHMSRLLPFFCSTREYEEGKETYIRNATTFVLAQFDNEATPRLKQIKQSQTNLNTKNCVIEWCPDKQLLRFSKRAQSIFSSSNHNYQKVLTREFYHKARKMYVHAGYGDEMSQFNARLYSCLQRYETLTKLDEYTGNTGTQGSLPVEVFQVLYEEFEVMHECYASSLNATMPTFCSIFPEVDRYFGGNSSFQNFRPPDAAFCAEVNPPFDRNSIFEAFNQCTGILERNDNQHPLLFILFTPWTPTGTSSGNEEMKTGQAANAFMLHKFVVKKKHVRVL
jgi:hypothetical protein